MKNALAIALLVLLTACAGTGPELRPSLPPRIHGLSPLAPLTCVFDKTVIATGARTTSSWQFLRQPNRIESRDEMSQQGEIWQKDAGGHIFYTRLFYPEHIALEYTPGDLAAIGVAPDWEQLEAGPVDPRNSEPRIKLVGRENASSIELERYSGTLEGIPTDIDWLPSLRLPARVAKSYRERTVILSMKDCWRPSAAHPQLVSSRELESYSRIDFSDLGDMESDPRVQRIMELTGGHHHEP